MKRTVQTHRGNATGAGHSCWWARKGTKDPIASVPRHEPPPRQLRRILKVLKRSPAPTMPKWAVMSLPLDFMFRKAGLMITPES